MATGAGLTHYRHVILPLLGVPAAGGISAWSRRMGVGKGVVVGCAGVAVLFVSGPVLEGRDVDPFLGVEPAREASDELTAAQTPPSGLLLGPEVARPAAEGRGLRPFPSVGAAIDMPGGEAGPVVPALVVEPQDRCGDAFTAFHDQGDRGGGVIASFSDSRNYVLIRKTGPYYGWEAVRVDEGTPTVLKLPSAPNRTGLVSLSRVENRFVLRQKGAVLLFFDIPPDSPDTMGIASSSLDLRHVTAWARPACLTPD